MSEKPARLDPEMVEAFVGDAHDALETTKKQLDLEPTLANAAWDWGGGDWETALGAASHVGRSDIAELLLGRGARIDIFAAAMLGEVEIVRAILAAYPQMRDALGPHGIPLIEHAQLGGARAREVLELLESVPASVPAE